jgi:hypothetical protein
VATYFAFSDESGQYRDNASDNWCRRNPYYVRSAVLLDIESWRTLRSRFFALKKDKHGLPADREIKWSYIWSLHKHRQNNEGIPKRAPYYFLRNVSERKLLDFVSDSCELLNECNYCKIMFTVTFNNPNFTTTKAAIYKMHLQELMQRVEMEIQSELDNLAILFLDPTSRGVDRLIRDAYSEIYFSGDFIKQYSHIKDSLSFELSHHSFGIQMADYAAGIFCGFLRGFKDSQELFDRRICGLIRKDDKSDAILGYGIREVPRNQGVRNRLKITLSNVSSLKN